MAKLTQKEQQKLMEYKAALDKSKQESELNNLRAENLNLRHELLSSQMQLYVSSLYIRHGMTMEHQISPNGEFFKEESKVVAEQTPVALDPVHVSMPKATPETTQEPMPAATAKPPLVKYGGGEISE